MVMNGGIIGVYSSSISLPRVCNESRRKHWSLFEGFFYLVSMKTLNSFANTQKGELSRFGAPVSSDSVISCVGGISLSMTYGLPVQRIDDPFIRSVATTFSRMGEAASAGKYLVNVIPVLKYVPEWVPGAGFKREARELREEMKRLMDVPFRKVQQIMVRLCLQYYMPSSDLREGRRDGCRVIRVLEYRKSQDQVRF